MSKCESLRSPSSVDISAMHASRFSLSAKFGLLTRASMTNSRSPFVLSLIDVVTFSSDIPLEDIFSATIANMPGLKRREEALE
jgi:hypothetical protein